jgi:ribosome-associated toxin RatA of RatAB toxin-antitoxin module
MGAIRIRATVDGLDAGTALRLVTDYRRWPAASEAIRSVRVDEDADGSSVSSWEVAFRGGLMRWTERDVSDHAALAHRFTLIEGDPHDFDGTWTAQPRGEGCLLEMLGEFDLGMPSLRHVLDPIAIEALEDAIADVLHALFGSRLRLEEAAASAAPAGGAR